MISAELQEEAQKEHLENSSAEAEVEEKKVMKICTFC